MNLKKIQAMPFAPFHEESKVRWKVTVKEPVVDGERLLVVDFLENLSCTAYRRDMPSFRIVCAKKSKEVKGINHEGRIQQKVLNCFSTPMWWYNEYVLISPREEEALSGTAMQYADLEGYLEEKRYNKNPIYFLEYHAKYPVIEFLWKAGYRNIVHNRIFGMDRENRNAILWERKKLKECFKFPLRILKLMPPEEWKLDDVKRANYLWKNYGERITDAEMRMALQSRTDVQNLTGAMPYAGIGKILKYIQKQTEKRKEEKGHTTYTPEGIIRAYRDYLRECEQLHFDLHDREILFPKDLTAAHNRTMEQVKFEKNKADQEKFQKAVEKLENFAWSEGEFFIRPAREQMELTAEGKALHHCVGGYIRDMAEEKTAIFFLRKVSEPDKPFYTLELQKKRVIQCRTEHNASYDRNPDVKNFVDMWMEKVVLKGKKKAKEAAA